MLLVEQFVGKGAKKLLALCGIDWFVDAEVTGKDALHVAVEYRVGLAEGQAHDGCCRIVAYAGQCTDEAVVAREASRPGYLLCRSMQVTGSAVVAQPLPKPEHLLLACFSQVHCGGKPLGKAQIVVHALCNLRLLKDELGEHDEVRVARVSPGKVAAIGFVPLLYFEFEHRFCILLSAKVHNFDVNNAVRRNFFNKNGPKAFSFEKIVVPLQSEKV